MSPKIGVLLIGSKGAVATTLLAAKAAMAQGLVASFPVPSEVEPAYAGLGLAQLSDLVFGGWDIVPDSYARSCEIHGVVPKHIARDIAGALDRTDVYPAIMTERNETIEKLCRSPHASQRMQDVDFAPTVFMKRPFPELVKSLEYDIADFRKKHRPDVLVMVNVASTDRQIVLTDVHQSLEAFEAGLKRSDPAITAGMLYAYAGIRNGCHLINFTPSMMMDIPALEAFAKAKGTAMAGKDGKTGQTLYKTIIAGMLKHRHLKLRGWYSTNILGNRDGQVLHDPAHRATKIEAKSAVLEKILGYADYDHQVHIHYYPPRGDAKEAWDSIDFSGWFDVPMQMKIDWLGDDSVLAAPLVFDLIRWVAFFGGQGEAGVLPQLAAYFKHPLGTGEYEFFRQTEMLKQHVGTRYGRHTNSAPKRRPARRAAAVR
ncbi:MAG: inositol-3-phosphate synthase [Candidatus Omnitrophica bacterium]|nr:inositol-3-phosphate synthase [Candidatus Omnitrophota bacterium]